MRALLILDAALFALSGTLAVVLGVVWILYRFNTDLSASVNAEMPTVASVMAIFAIMAAALAAAFWSLLRHAAWKWWAQVVAAAGLVVGSLLLYRVLTA